MNPVEIIVIDSLKDAVSSSDPKTKKLFYKQKQFMEMNKDYPSLGKTKLKNVKDKYGNDLWEIRLDRKRRIVFIEKEEDKIIWLKICNHDELKRNNVVRAKDCY